MAKIHETRIHPVFLVALVVIAAVASLNLTSCTPGSGISAQESDVVLTRYDTEIDFGAIKTYAMPDSIFHILAEDDTSKLSRDNDAAIISLINANFEARGYELVPESNPTPPDVGVILRATAVEVWQLYSYYPGYPGWGGWWPGWGGWYPYYPPGVGGGYAYTTGTLFVDMFDPDSVVENPDGSFSIEAYWQGTINGILDDTTASKNQRLADSINQLFVQSPYLESRQ
jgi:hypothetical protein